jgi:hypothetical protein
MSVGAFILLKAGRAGPKTAKQAEIRLANLLKILRIAGSGGQSRSRGGKGAQSSYSRRFLPDMANLPGITGFVIQITIWTQKLAQYPVSQYREKITRISDLVSIHRTT